MRTPARKLDPEIVRAKYPLSDRLPGWFFRVSEESPGHYVAEGTDLSGRTVSISSGEDALERAVDAARDVESQVHSV
jgi:hypothetical protein